MIEYNERVMREIDRMTERADRERDDLRYGPDIYRCTRCGQYGEEEARCLNCGEHRGEP